LARTEQAEEDSTFLGRVGYLQVKNQRQLNVEKCDNSRCGITHIEKLDIMDICNLLFFDPGL